MRTIVKNQRFPDLYKFSLWEGETKVRDLIRARSSELSNFNFIETDFRYTQGKLEFDTSSLLDDLTQEDKNKIILDGPVGIEKYLSSLFPTIIHDSREEDDLIDYYSSLTKIGGDEIICLLIPERVNKITATDSHGEDAIEVEFEGDEIRDSKALCIITSFEPGSPRTVNLSYEAYKKDKNPVKRMSEYVLRNDDLIVNRKGYTERDGFLYSSISGSLIGTKRVENRPIYDLKNARTNTGWNRARRYSIGDTVKIGDTVYESVDENNIGNHPYYSRMWVKYDN